MKVVLPKKQGLLIMLLGLVVVSLVGCKQQKYTQCEQIITLANGVAQQTQTVVEAKSDRRQELKAWLEAADIMSQAAVNIEALQIQDPQLIQYQSSLANIYRVYSQATYDAVKAREHKNLQALATARSNANKMGQFKNDLVKGINDYCLGQD